MSKEDMVLEIAETARKLFYEDVEFFWKFVIGYAERKEVA